jgi:hypothetical protein
VLDTRFVPSLITTFPAVPAVVGQVGVEGTKFVPLLITIDPPVEADPPIVNPVVKFGEVAPLNNAAPVPFSSLTAALRFALLGVVTNVSIPEASAVCRSV